MRVENLIQHGADSGRVIRVCLGMIDHATNIVEIGLERTANGLQQQHLRLVSPRFDLGQARQHFLGAGLGFRAEFSGGTRLQSQLVGHAADGDDVDAQVHRLAGNLFLHS